MCSCVDHTRGREVSSALLTCGWFCTVRGFNEDGQVRSVTLSLQSSQKLLPSIMLLEGSVRTRAHMPIRVYGFGVGGLVEMDTARSADV